MQVRVEGKSTMQDVCRHGASTSGIVYNSSRYLSPRLWVLGTIAAYAVYINLIRFHPLFEKGLGSGLP